MGAAEDFERDVLNAFDIPSGFEEVTGSGSADAWDFDKDHMIRGIYTAKKTELGPNKSNMYIIENVKDHQEYGVWGSTVLDDRFAEIMIGEEVIVVYEGKVRGKNGSSYKSYKVYHQPIK